MRVRYLYTFGRRERLDTPRGTYPTEMFYGLPYLRDRNHSVDYWEQDANKKARSPAPLGLRLMDRLLARTVGTGSNATLLLDDVENIKKADVVIAQPDSVAIGAATLRKRGYFETPVIGIFMGLADRLYRMRVRHPLRYTLARRYYGSLLGQLKNIAVIGKGEEDFLRDQFPEHEPRITFLTFGVDTDFWQRADSPSAGPVLFIGIDSNRDFKLTLDIARSLPDQKFIFVTSRIKPADVPSNVELHGADWRRALLSDSEMRDLYHASSAVILPIRDCLQPSGQSVALQAMACGTPVIMSRTRGLWDPAHLRHEEHLLLIDQADTPLWLTAISRIRNDGALRQSMTSAARDLVEKRYTAEKFAGQLEQLLTS